MLARDVVAVIASAALSGCVPPAIDYGDTAGDSESGADGAAGVCGDGVVQEGEGCDDANDDDLDDCHDDCTLPGRTLWRVEFPNRTVTDIAVTADRVYLCGKGPKEASSSRWFGALDLDGAIVEDEAFVWLTTMEWGLDGTLYLGGTSPARNAPPSCGLSVREDSVHTASSANNCRAVARLPTQALSAWGLRWKVSSHSASAGVTASGIVCARMTSSKRRPTHRLVAVAPRLPP